VNWKPLTVNWLSYQTLPWFFKRHLEKNSRRSADTTIPASKEMEKEK
jgi:hypothetical protein